MRAFPHNGAKLRFLLINLYGSLTLGSNYLVSFSIMLCSYVLVNFLLFFHALYNNIVVFLHHLVSSLRNIAGDELSDILASALEALFCSTMRKWR